MINDDEDDDDEDYNDNEAWLTYLVFSSFSSFPFAVFHFVIELAYILPPFWPSFLEIPILDADSFLI